METLETRRDTRNPLPYIVVGAVLAPLIILLASYMTANSGMRDTYLLLFVPVVGALAGWIIYALNPFGKPRGWQKSILLFVALLVYSIAVLFGLIIAQIGSF